MIFQGGSVVVAEKCLLLLRLTTRSGSGLGSLKTYGVWRSPVSAPALGAGSRRFESFHPDSFSKKEKFLKKKMGRYDKHEKRAPQSSRAVKPEDKQRIARYARANAGISASLLTGLTLTAALSIANLCFFQPLAEQLQQDFGTTAFVANLATTLTQTGYTAGILFLVPTGDMFNRKRLMLVVYAILLAGLALTAAAPNIGVVLGACLLVGVGVCAAQILVPMVSLLSRPENKSRNVGYMVSGILVGMLLSRVLSGFIGERWGWRTMFCVAMALMLCCTLFVLWRMPNVAPTYHGSYGNLLRSIIGLVRHEHDVALCAVRSGLVFGTFQAFWSTISFHMADAPFHAGADVVGMFGLCGIAGALVASGVGSLVHKIGTRGLNLYGGGAVLAAWLCLWAFQGSYVGMVTGVVLIDAGVQACNVTNQTYMFSRVQNAVSRVNTVFMGSLFICGSVGTFLAGAAFGALGWSGVCMLGVLMTCASLALTLTRKY